MVRKNFTDYIYLPPVST